MKKILLLLIPLLGLAFLQLSCKKKVEDPVIIQPEIQTYTRLNGGKEYKGESLLFNVYEDTFVNFPTIYFTTNIGYNSYKWYIGNEANPREGKAIGVNFSGFEGTIQATFIGERYVNGVTQIDSLSKSIVILHNREALYIGKFEGSFSFAPDVKLTLEIFDPLKIENFTTLGLWGYVNESLCPNIYQGPWWDTSKIEPPTIILSGYKYFTGVGYPPADFSYCKSYNNPGVDKSFGTTKALWINYGKVEHDGSIYIDFYHDYYDRDSKEGTIITKQNFKGKRVQ
jgi:hypothetical protein